MHWDCQRIKYFLSGFTASNLEQVWSLCQSLLHVVKVCQFSYTEFHFTVFSQLNAPGVYFKLGMVEPAFL